ncbi:MAG: LCP family protein [Actinomycetota bacterium]|nr:LCP family protein [Actinomycetota bacterium]
MRPHADPEPPPDYRVYRARPRLFGRRDERRGLEPLRPPGDPPPRTRRRVSVRRVVRWLVLAVLGWVLLSLVVFLVSAQLGQGAVDDEAGGRLGGGGTPPLSATNVLVLGSDRRSEETSEPGASTTERGRSDSILLLRAGGGANERLSVARDTLVDIPGAGRQKINAAYAIGGPALALATVEGYTGIDVNHLIEVSFEDFPALIDAMGGITYRGGCVISRVNGGDRNGGVTVRIRAGRDEHLDGRRALALARTRKNECKPRENDLTRARRQQRIIAAMKARMLSPAAFVRLPWIAWQVPRTFRTDMSGPTLLGLFAALAVGGDPETKVLGTVSGEVPETLRRARVDDFLGE